MSGEPSISKAAALTVAILTIVSIICGAVFWIVHQNDMLQMQVQILSQQVSANSEGIRSLNGKRTDDEENFNKIMQIIALSHSNKK